MAVNISRGSTGEDVKEVQRMLNELGYDTGGIDGIAGAKTEAAIKAFQESTGGALKVDSIAGANTQAALREATSGSSEAETPAVSSNVIAGAEKGGNVYNYYNTVDRDPFTTSSTTDDWAYQLANYTDNSYGDYSESADVKARKAELQAIIASEPASYTESDRVKKAREELAQIEAGKPAAFDSRYDSTINELLDTIKNRKAFDVNTDTNYQTLYNNYKQNYQVQADKAMRDTMGAATAATGGYGSTYAQQVGQQAYDNTMQGLNDQNINLMNLAYSMYSDDRANDYNKLSAYQNQDNIDYSRYRDTVNDWQTDRSYYANRADTAYNQDYGQYRDTVSDWQTDRAFAENRFENERNFDYGQYETGLNQWNTDRAFTADMYNQSYANDLSQYEYDTSYDQSAKESIYDKAMAFASQGIQVPSSYYSQLSESEIEAINKVAQQTVAEQQKTASSSRGNGSGGNASGGNQSVNGTGDTYYDYTEALDNAFDNGASESDEIVMKTIEEMNKKYGADAYSKYKTSRGL